MTKLHPVVQRTALGSLLLLLAILGLTCITPSHAQVNSAENRPRSRAAAAYQSQAERAAGDLVALSADTIVGFLRVEAGLLLQAKRLLVISAYEQGRVVDAKDLEDEAFFRLVQEDQSFRVLITREIEERHYVQAKPRREELEQGDIYKMGSSPESTGTPARNQEDTYWSRHEVGSEHHLEHNGGSDQNTLTPNADGDHSRQTESPRLSSPAPQQRMGRPLPSPDNDEAPRDEPAQPRVRPQESPSLLTTTADESLNIPGQESGSGEEYSRAPGKALSSSSSWSNSPRSNPELGVSQSADASFPNATNASYRPPRGSEIPQRPPPEVSSERAPRHRPNPYADVPSLYDLYAQYSAKPGSPERFGIDVFRKGTGNLDQLPMDMPVGPEYVLGPGDGLSVDLWGGVSQRLQRVVDRQGRISLPEVGAVEVSGRNLGEVQRLVQKVLRTQFRDVEADISLSRLRTVRIYVVGDVERPGAYDVSSLSTPLNAVYEAGGPTARGSLRVLRHLRGKQLIQEIDVYGLLLHGIRTDLEGLQPGDTILVPPLGGQVTIEGMVRRPAIYELGGEGNLAEVLELAGGVLQSGTLRHVDVERIEAHLSRSMLRLDIPEDNNQENVAHALEEFKVQDGDKIKISPILPYADKTVYLEGHVFRPGKFAYREGMRITDIVKSYADLLPEPSHRHAEIIRLSPPDNNPVVLAFNLEGALAGTEKDLVLKPFDTIRIFGRFDFEDPPVITVNGEVRDPGDHLTNGTTYLRDAVYLAGGATPDAQMEDAQVFRKTEAGKLAVLNIDLGRALAGDNANNILLQPKDRIFIHRNLTKVDPPTVKIEGEVERPGMYPLGQEMTAADLVRVAGGFKRGAYTELADLTRYEVERGVNVSGEHRTVEIARALAGEPDTDLRLHDGDVLSVRQIAGWNDVGATITLKGEVLHPGTYGIQEGERLSSVLARAGGLRSGAYPYGTVFERVQVRSLEENNRTVLIREVQDDGLSLKAMPVADSDSEDKKAREASLLQWQRTMERLQNTPPNGRLVVHISRDVRHWANTPADPEMRAGDVLYVPKRPNLVMVDGSVYNPTAVTFKPGKSAGWYLAQAGGPTNMANKKAIFVIRADGSVAGGSGGLFAASAEKIELRAGDMVVVPEKAFSGSTKWRNTLQVAQVMQAAAFAVSLGRAF